MLNWFQQDKPPPDAPWLISTSFPKGKPEVTWHHCITDIIPTSCMRLCGLITLRWSSLLWCFLAESWRSVKSHPTPPLPSCSWSRWNELFGWVWTFTIVSHLQSQDYVHTHMCSRTHTHTHTDGQMTAWRNSLKLTINTHTFSSVY